MGLGRHAHQGRVILVVGLDNELHHVAVLALGILLDIDAGQELDAVKFVETLDAPGGRCVVAC